MKKILRRTPHVAVILESSHEISRGMIRGILKYIHLYAPWNVDIVYGGPQDQRLPDKRYWKGNGIIGRIPNPRIAEEIIATRLPAVIIDPTDEFLQPNHPLSQYNSVRCDSASVGRMAADYLLNGNFRHFAFVGEVNGINWSRCRQETFAIRLAESGFSCNIYNVPVSLKQDWNLERKEMSRWLKRLPKPLALFAANDQRARQVLDACQKASLAVPYEIAVLGVNNDQLLCEMIRPPLSSIPLESENAGFLAAQMLDQLMKNQSPPQHTVWFAPLPVVTRESTKSIYVTNKKVVTALEFIRINSGTKIRVSDVVKQMKVTRQWAEKSFKRELGHSIMEEIKEVRLQMISSLVGRTEISFQEIATQCGFESANYLGVLFKKYFGTTMSEYRQQYFRHN
jgi:LacI family transcriptional regulator